MVECTKKEVKKGGLFGKVEHMISFYNSNDKCIYAFGGYGKYLYHYDELYRYNTVTSSTTATTTTPSTTDSSWTIQKTKGPKPSGRCAMAFCFCSDRNMLYIFGGRKSNNLKDGIDNLLYCFDFSQMQWSTLSSSSTTSTTISDNMEYPMARYASHMCYNESSSCLYLYGGFHNQQTLNDLWKFDLLQQKWECIVPLLLQQQPLLNNEYIPSARCHHFTCHVPSQNALYVFGGSNQQQEACNDIWCFDFEKEIWTKKWPLPPPPLLSSTTATTTTESISKPVVKSTSLTSIATITTNNLSKSSVRSPSPLPQKVTKIVFKEGIDTPLPMASSFSTTTTSTNTSTNSITIPSKSNSCVCIGNRFIISIGSNECNHTPNVDNLFLVYDMETNHLYSNQTIWNQFLTMKKFIQIGNTSTTCASSTTTTTASTIRSIHKRSKSATITTSLDSYHQNTMFQLELDSQSLQPLQQQQQQRCISPTYCMVQNHSLVYIPLEMKLVIIGGKQLTLYNGMIQIALLSLASSTTDILQEWILEMIVLENNMNVLSHLNPYQYKHYLEQNDFFEKKCILLLKQGNSNQLQYVFYMLLKYDYILTSSPFISKEVLHFIVNHLKLVFICLQEQEEVSILQFSNIIQLYMECLHLICKYHFTVELWNSELFFIFKLLLHDFTLPIHQLRTKQFQSYMNIEFQTKSKEEELKETEIEFEFKSFYDTIQLMEYVQYFISGTLEMIIEKYMDLLQESVCNEIVEEIILYYLQCTSKMEELNRDNFVHFTKFFATREILQHCLEYLNIPYSTSTTSTTTATTSAVNASSAMHSTEEIKEQQEEQVEREEWEYLMEQEEEESFSMEVLQKCLDGTITLSEVLQHKMLGKKLEEFIELYYTGNTRERFTNNLKFCSVYFKWIETQSTSDLDHLTSYLNHDSKHHIDSVIWERFEGEQLDREVLDKIVHAIIHSDLLEGFFKFKTSKFFLNWLQKTVAK